MLRAVAGQQFYKTFPLDFRRMLDDSNHIADNLRAYIGGFSPAARDVIEKFDFNTQITKLDKANLLDKIIARFAEIDLQAFAVTVGVAWRDSLRAVCPVVSTTWFEALKARSSTSRALWAARS